MVNTCNEVLPRTSMNKLDLQIATWMDPKTVLGRKKKLNEIYHTIPLMKLKNTCTHRKHDVSFKDGRISKHILNKTEWLFLWERERGE